MTTHPDRDTAATLTIADRTVIADAAQRIADEADTISVHDFAVVMLDAAARIKQAAVAAQPPQGDPQPDEREAELHGPGWFWTRTEWAEWSNKLAMLFTEDEAHGNPDGAQESVIFDTFTAWAEERRRDPDTGLRERVEAASRCQVRWSNGGTCDDQPAERCHGCVVRAALAEPTPGVES